jgi:hypothetical protein
MCRHIWLSKWIFCGKQCHGHYGPLVGSVNDTADHWWTVSGWQIQVILTRSGPKLQKIRLRIRPQSNIIIQWHCRPVMDSVNDAADLSWAVLVTLRIQLCKLYTKTSQCQWHRWSMVGSFNDTADHRWAVSMTPLTPSGMRHWYRPPGWQIQVILTGSGSTLLKILLQIQPQSNIISK